MIFMSNNEKPICYAYVNSITERTALDGSSYKVIGISTSEKAQDGTKKYSSWFCNLIGDARNVANIRPLQKNDNIAIYGIKLTNQSKKDEQTGQWGKAFLNCSISKYVLQENNRPNIEVDSENPF